MGNTDSQNEVSRENSLITEQQDDPMAAAMTAAGSEVDMLMPPIEQSGVAAGPVGSAQDDAAAQLPQDWSSGLGMDVSQDMHGLNMPDSLSMRGALTADPSTQWFYDLVATQGVRLPWNMESYNYEPMQTLNDL